jgi:type IX secretion system PorP/SprF family membrane protein
MNKPIVSLRALLTFAFITLMLVTQAQDPEFTQFSFNPIYTNPALAGTGMGCGRFNFSYRNQWPSLVKSYETYSASFDKHYDNLAGGIGLQITSDQAGEGLLTTRTASAIYSYHLQLTKNLALRAGLQATFCQRSIDFSKLVFSDMLDPRYGRHFETKEPIPATSITFPNFSTGAILYNDAFYAGVAVHNLIEPNQSFYQSNDPGAYLPRRFTVHGGMNIPLGNYKQETTLSPQMLFMVQRQFTQVNFGLNLQKKSFITGLWWRQTRSNADALMVLVGLKKDLLRITYSYDLTVSNNRTAAVGSHEIALSIGIKCGNKPKTKMDCYFNH